MITANIPHLGQSQTIGPCEGPYGAKKTFYLEGDTLVVPDLFTDKKLRWLVDQGRSFEEAYREVGWWGDYQPPDGMTQCLYDILRTKYFDPISGTWKRSGWGHTCAGYFACFEAYVEAKRQTMKAGRILIAPGVYSPSPAEEVCIKRRHHQTNDIARAYSECGAIDILPTFPGAIDGLNKLMRQSIATPMYEMIKTVHAFAPKEPTVTHHGAPVVVQAAEPSRLILYAGIAAAVIIAMR